MTILIPVSLGELYDKISILKIKTERIDDEEKIKNVQKELDLLLKIAEKNPIESYYHYKLYKTNDSLWNIEDKLREYESKELYELYDDTFIDLAKQVYQLNDRRSRIKKEINLQYNSDIIEEKSYKEY